MKKILALAATLATLVACGNTPKPILQDGFGFLSTNTNPSQLYVLDFVGSTPDKKVGIVRDATTEAGFILSDLASNGSELYGVSNTDELYKIDPETAKATKIATLSDGIIALAFDNNGQLWGAYGDIFKINKTTGVMTKVNSTAPTVFASGDIVFSSSNELYMSVPTPNTGDDLYKINTSTGAPTRVGSLGIPGVWGLGSIGNKVYGGTSGGVLIEINLQNGTSTTFPRNAPGPVGALGNRAPQQR